MPELFVAMMKEEWRIHSTIFGNLGFALFPAVIAVFAFLGSLTLPTVSSIHLTPPTKREGQTLCVAS